MRRWSIVAVVTVVSVLATEDGRAAECRTPAEYAAAFDAGSACAVDACLYSVITEAEAAPTHPYPRGFAKAWLSGHRTLAAFLQLRSDTGLRCALTDRALRIVGFPPPFAAAPYQLHVIDGCALEDSGHVIGIPTVAEWVRELESAYAIEIPMPVFRTLAADGMDFEKATGCRGRHDSAGEPIDARACAADAGFPERDTCSCAPAFVDAYKALRDLSPYRSGQTTSECFRTFGTLPPSVPALRAALWACQDVDPYNALNGLGFDGRQLTLPEFIVDNIGFAEMGADTVATIPLPDPTHCGGR